MSHDRYHVNVSALNLRSSPAVDRRNRVDVLPEGQVVDKIAEAEKEGWWHVSTIRHGVTVTGFVFSAYLSPGSSNGHELVSGIVEVHLKPKSHVTRHQASGRAYPIREDRMPFCKATTMEARVQQMTDVVHWLDVEKHARYLRVGTTTYCNIYAYDYAYLCGAYVPRVWWNEVALLELAGGGKVAPMYGVTVREMNANMLTDWFEEYGELFGWAREYDLHGLQKAANRGEVCMIVAQRSELNQPGHICAVVPETPRHRARRAEGRVAIPLQSQAGAENYRYGTVEWWIDRRYRKFGFWRMGVDRFHRPDAETR